MCLYIHIYFLDIHTLHLIKYVNAVLLYLLEFAELLRFVPVVCELKTIKIH